MNPSPSEYQRNVALDLVLTLLLCGLWNMVVQSSHCKAMNYLLKQEKYSFWKMYIFTLLTCGIYFIYHEYRKASDLASLTHSDDSSDVVLAVLLSILGLNFIYDAIFQTKINEVLRAQDSIPPV